MRAPRKAPRPRALAWGHGAVVEAPGIEERSGDFGYDAIQRYMPPAQWVMACAIEALRGHIPQYPAGNGVNPVVDSMRELPCATPWMLRGYVLENRTSASDQDRRYG